MNDHTCVIEGCARDIKKRSMCGMHYLRWWKTGDAGSARSDREIRADERAVAKCPVEGCGQPPRPGGKNLCEMHYGRIRRNGDPNTVINMRREDAAYRSAHSRVRRDRGAAREYQCIDCGTQAQHWSYAHTDSNELKSPGGQPYSLDPQHYEPRCVVCHWAFDHAQA